MKSKTSTDTASAISMVEMAWSARMTKFLEEKDRLVDNGYLKELLIDLNINLGSSNGKIEGINFSEDSNQFSIIYKDQSGNNYIMDIERNGKATVTENHVQEQTVAEDLNTFYAVTQKSVSKSELYGTKVETGVTEINGIAVQDNWKIFYIDDAESRIYLIYGEYYPVSGLQNLDENVVVLGGKLGSKLYGINGNEYGNENDFIEYLKTSNNWTKICEALTENGKKFYGKSLSAVGSPSLDIWTKSFNDKYFENIGWINIGDNEEFNYFNSGNYTVSTPEKGGTLVTRSTKTSPIYYDYGIDEIEYVNSIRVDGVLKKAYDDDNGTQNGYTDNLYFPRKKNEWDGEYGRVLRILANRSLCRRI